MSFWKNLFGRGKGPASVVPAMPRPVAPAVQPTAATPPSAAKGAVQVQIKAFGIYRAKVERVVPNPAAASGYTNQLGPVALIKQTDRIPLQKKLTLGVTFVPSGRAPGQPVRLKHVWRFPPPGIKNPDTGKTCTSEETETEFVFGTAGLVSYTFDVDFEMLPGPWTLEVWDGTTKLAEKTLTVEAFHAHFSLEGTDFPLFNQEEPFFESCRTAGQGALVMKFRDFWEVGRRGSQCKAIGGGMRLLCAKCCAEMPFSFQMGLPGGFGGSMIAFGEGLPGNLGESAKAAACPWCHSVHGILLWDYAPLGEITERDLAALRELWKQRGRLWWRQNSRSEGICDDCSSQALARGEGYLKGSSLVCEACAQKSTRAEVLAELRKKPDYFGTSELRRARHVVSGKWRFEAGKICSSHDLF